VVTVHGKTAGVLAERPNPAALQSPVRGDGGLFSTARDYGTFLQVFLNGGRRGATRLVSEASIRTMTSNQIGQVVVEQQADVEDRCFARRHVRTSSGWLPDRERSGRRRIAQREATAGEGSTIPISGRPAKGHRRGRLMQVLLPYDESCIQVWRVRADCVSGTTLKVSSWLMAIRHQP
jgi:CubicO group peptidase (beta-lactamase class C family)